MIDIVLATYNGEKYIGEQINSIINQTFKEWRLIIRDDESKDKTAKLIEEYSKKDSRITVINDGKGNLGFNGNFTTLLEASSADYVMICDQDDSWIPEKIEIMYSEISKYKKDDKILVHSDVFLTDENLEITNSFFIGKRGSRYGINGIIMANSVQGASCMMTKALKESYLKNRVNMPYDYNISLIAEMTGKRVYIEKPLMYYRQHQSNAIGAGGEKGDSKNRVMEFLVRKFSFKFIKMEIGKFEQVKQLSKNLINEIPNSVKKEIEDYLYIADRSKFSLFRMVKFYKKRYTMYRKIDNLTGGFYFLLNKN